MFLDASGSSPMTPRTVEAFLAGLADGWADPARLHSESRRARQLLDAARVSIASALGISAEQTHFTASAHLGFERVITGMVAARRGRTRVLVSAIERDAVLAAADFAVAGNVTLVPVDRLGHLDLESLRTELANPDVAVLAVQHANHEVGTVQRLATIAAHAHERGVPLVVDATASIGHGAVPDHWDALVANPADWGGPAGVGVVAVAPRTRWLQPWPEGGGFAPGGVSVPAALAAAVALEERREHEQATWARLHGLVAKIRARAATWPGIDVVGDPDERLPHVVTFSCLYVDGEALLSRLDREGIAVGSGSACTTSTYEPSRVLASMGALSHGNVRLGLHPAITDADIDRFLALMPRLIADLRAQAGAPALD